MPFIVTCKNVLYVPCGIIIIIASVIMKFSAQNEVYCQDEEESPTLPKSFRQPQ